MRFRRVLIALAVMALIVLFGLYWEGRRTNITDQTSEQSTERSALKTPDIDASNWDVSPEATLSLERETGSDTASKVDHFTVPGRVLFPKDIPSESITLKVEILPVRASRALKIQQSRTKNPKQALLKGGPWKSLQGQSITKTLTTDENGQFSIKNAPPGVYRVSSADTDWSGRTDNSIIQLASQVTPVQFSVQQNAKLIGHVVNQDKEPLPNARIPFTTSARELTADKNGKFVLNRLEPGTPIDFVKIMKEGYRSHYLSVEPLQPGETRHDTFVLKQGANLSVTVRTSDGRPVKEGRLMLRRLDDKKIQAKMDYALAHGGGRMKSINDEGKVLFSGLQPGRVKVYLTFANYLSRPKKIEIKSGQTVETTLSVMKGIPVTVKHVNKRTGQTVDGVRPRITAFDGKNQKLEPAFKFRGFNDDGDLKGVIHPDARKITVRSESRRFKPKTTSFDRSDFPTLKIALTPSQAPEESRTPPGLLKLNLSRAGKFQWEDVTGVRAYLLDRTTGQRVLGRAGHQSTFKEPFPVDKGKYIFYSLIKTKAENYVVMKPLTIQTQHPGQKSVTPERAATVSGKILLNDRPLSGEVKVAISLLSPRSRKQAPTRNVYYPSPLSVRPNNDGEFTIPAVPPEQELGLHVVSTGGPKLGAPMGKVLINKPLPVLSPGQKRTVTSINITK